MWNSFITVPGNTLFNSYDHNMTAVSFQSHPALIRCHWLFTDSLFLLSHWLGMKSYVPWPPPRPPLELSQEKMISKGRLHRFQVPWPPLTPGSALYVYVLEKSFIPPTRCINKSWNAIHQIDINEHFIYKSIPNVLNYILEAAWTMNMCPKIILTLGDRSNMARTEIFCRHERARQ